MTRGVPAERVLSAADIHEASLKNFERRRTSAVLLLAALNGREEVKIAVRQGEWERWTSEYLAEVKRLEEEANKELAGRLMVVGRFILTLNIWE